MLYEDEAKLHSSSFPVLCESMQLGGLAGLTALTMGLGQERAMREREAVHDRCCHDGREFTSTYARTGGTTCDTEAA